MVLVLRQFYRQVATGVALRLCECLVGHGEMVTCLAWIDPVYCQRWEGIFAFLGHISLALVLGGQESPLRWERNVLFGTPMVPNPVCPWHVLCF